MGPQGTTPQPISEPEPGDGAASGVIEFRRVSEHLLVFPERDDADEVAEELREEGFTEVRVLRQPLAGEDDPEADEWAVYVREANIADDSGPVAGGLRERFEATAQDRGGWYDPDPEPRYGE